MNKFFRLSLPLTLLALIEIAFQQGIWEPLAKPGSHAGTSVRLKRALTDASAPYIDFVTLGSSRPEYGLDHERLAAEAQAKNLVHANLSMPGVHWMTISILTQWLAEHHPEIHGGIIALSIQDFVFTGNGSYELGIISPFRAWSDMAEVTEHVPFIQNDISSYGVYSALFLWRGDIQDFLRRPLARLKGAQWQRSLKPEQTLFHNPSSSGDMCNIGLDSLAACEQVANGNDSQASSLQRQCQELRAGAAQRSDYHQHAALTPLPEFMNRTKLSVQHSLRSLSWPVPPVILLMPVPRVWKNSVSPIGLHEWALQVLNPLVDEGKIKLIDATDYFDQGSHTDCTAFFDFYHQNASGREQLTAWLLPQLQAELYGQQSMAISVSHSK